MAIDISEKVRSLLMESGYITEQPKSFTAEDIVSMLSNPSLAMKAFRLSAFLRETECATCKRTFISKRMRPHYLQTCSDDCANNYLQNVLFKWTPDEKQAINKLLGEFNIHGVLELIRKKRGEAKMHGLYSSMAKKGGCNEYVISQLLNGNNKSPSSKSMLKFFNACGICLQVK
jgi:hypothetical protein